MGVFPLDTDEPTLKKQLPITSFEGRNGTEPKAVAIIRRTDSNRQKHKVETKTDQECVGELNDLVDSQNNEVDPSLKKILK